MISTIHSSNSTYLNAQHSTTLLDTIYNWLLWSFRFTNVILKVVNEVYTSKTRTVTNNEIQ